MKTTDPVGVTVVAAVILAAAEDAAVAVTVAVVEAAATLMVVEAATVVAADAATPGNSLTGAPRLPASLTSVFVAGAVRGECLLPSRDGSAPFEAHD